MGVGIVCAAWLNRCLGRRSGLVKRYCIRAGVRCEVAAGDGVFKPHSTTKQTELDDPVSTSRSFWTFRVGEWQLRVSPRCVWYRGRDGWRPVKA